MVTTDPRRSNGRDSEVEIVAPSLDELFAAAARALCGWITEAEDVMPRESRVVELAAPGPRRLLEAWLRELLLVFETEGLLFSRAKVELDSSAAERVVLRGRLWGEPFDPERHPLKTLVKTVNGRALEMRQNGDGWRARLVGSRT